MRDMVAALTMLNAAPAMIDAAQPISVDMDWLSRELVGLEDVRQMAEAALEQYAYGVVYALRLNETDIEGITWNGAMGFEAAGPISASTIIAKAIVLPSFVWDDLRNTENAWLERSGGLAAAFSPHR